VSSSTEAVREHAKTRLGFDAVHFTTPEATAHTEFMRAWLDAGMHGEMGYLEHRHALRSGRLDHPNLFESAKTVIVVALSYDFPEVKNKSEATGVIARYARGEDYHRVFREKLRALSRWLAEAFPGTQSRGFTDSGPIRERELAARAGLGWQGKHTNLISLTLGNWFFLGALLTSLELTPDAPFSENHCGTCTRCLAACPTGALIAPHTLDARRCISYLTIELKSSIPIELRPLMGDRIFGCDDCLAACPWNDRAKQAQEMRLAARDADAAYPSLLALLALLETEAAFEQKFRGTPILRTGRASLRRNVCVALGNSGDKAALTALAFVAETDPSELVREHALWAINAINRCD
jgi:epoxyqueuosine reductase